VALDMFLIKDAKIYEKKFKIAHNHQESVKDIKAIEFLECTLTEFPRSPILLDFVKNLISLALFDCNLTKISREDLHGLGCLRELYLAFNSIEQLPKRLFEHTPNLEIISFWRNRIKEIDSDILDPLKKLKLFELRNNISINVVYSSIAGYRGTVTLAQLKAAIKEKCVPVENIIEEMRKEIDNLKKDIADLKKDVFDLKKNNGELKRENYALKKDVGELKKKNNAALQRKFDELEASHSNLSAEFKKLKQLKEKQIVSDFIVSVNGKVFNVNKAVLAANSPLLKKLIDENRDVDHLELKDVSEKTFEEILSFMQTKKPPNNAANLVELFGASARLEMKELMNATANILKKKVTPANALEILNLCKKYPHEELGKKAFNEMKKIYG
jgi:FtsZ-binding cell division protein ZapB